MISIVSVEAFDIRFPTSRTLDGSDAMNPDPDYSAAVCILRTSVDGLEGHGMTFTIGRGTEICVAAIEALAPFVIGLELERIQADMGAFARRIAGDSQLRWLGPEKGVVHLAAAAVINAVWDLWGRVAEKPVWRLVAEMEPDDIVRLIDFRHIKDALTPEEARDLLVDRRAGRAARHSNMLERGLAAYTTSAGCSAMTTTRSGGCAVKRWPRAGGRSSSRWEWTPRRTSRAAASRARSSVPAAG